MSSLHSSEKKKTAKQTVELRKAQQEINELKKDAYESRLRTKKSSDETSNMIRQY